MQQPTFPTSTPNPSPNPGQVQLLEGQEEKVESQSGVDIQVFLV